MNMLNPHLVYTAEEFLNLRDGEGMELIDGKIVEKNIGAESSYYSGVLFARLYAFCLNPFLGWVFPAETSFQIHPSRPNLVRKPDAAFIRAGRLPGEVLPLGHIRLVPDLVAEVVSPNDLYYEVEEKVAEYRLAGVQLIWILCPPTKTVLVRRGNGTASEIGENGELDGEQVLPGFRCRVAELFASPVPPVQSTSGS